MDWQHPFITIDQNQLRDPDAVARVLDECCRNGLRLLLPDGAFLEFSKSGCPFDTARRSLQVLAPHRELIYSSRKLTDLLREEFHRRVPCDSVVQEDATEFLRSVLAELKCGNESTLRRLVDGPVTVMMPPALDVWNNHDENRRLIQGLHDALKLKMSPDQLKGLRQSPQNGVAEWLSSEHGTRFVFQGLKARGADDHLAYALTRSPSASAGFLSALAGVAVYWLAFGGLASAAAKESSGDLNDVEYVVLGALSHSLATFDKRAQLICRAVADAFETRLTLPSIAIP